jgi:two-component system CheB/CheR fusion protein
VAVLDRDLRIDVWNESATELWGVRRDEARRAHFFNLDFGLPVAELHQSIRDVIHGSGQPQDLILSAVNRKGRPFHCRVRVLPLRTTEGAVAGAILLMEESTAAPTVP